MPSVTRSVLVPYGASQMFDLVEHVEAYPEFLPWCGGSDVLERSDGRTIVTLRIDYRGLRQSFTTVNLHSHPSWIEIRLRDGPFTRLEADWEFLSLRDDACKVAFRIEYAFAGALLSKALSPVFDHIAAGVVDAFVRRAESLYG
jgi:ribosome-associated toxin RatA of RatAB toxin-antitoxin module